LDAEIAMNLDNLSKIFTKKQEKKGNKTVKGKINSSLSLGQGIAYS
jgi:hypothetical protein